MGQTGDPSPGPATASRSASAGTAFFSRVFNNTFKLFLRVFNHCFDGSRIGLMRVEDWDGDGDEGMLIRITSSEKR